jgi:hypothetical protein
MAKQYVVKHTMLGVINPITGEDYREGEVVDTSLLGDKTNFDRLVKAGAVGVDLREEPLDNPSDAEIAGVLQSHIVDLDPAASPLADNQDSTAQAQGQPDSKNKK